MGLAQEAAEAGIERVEEVLDYTGLGAVAEALHQEGEDHRAEVVVQIDREDLGTEKV